MQRSAGKNAKKTPSPPKKPVPVKRKTVSKRRKKPGASDALYAVLMTGILISAAALISCAFIVLKSSQKARLPQAQTPAPSVPPQAGPAIHSEPPPLAIKALPEQPLEKHEPLKPVQEPQPAPLTPPRTEQTRQAPRREQQPERAPQTPPQTQQTARPHVPPKTVQPQSPPEKPRPAHQGTLVFVIDDAGNNLRELEPFLRFPGPLTIAVLPGLPHSAEAARRIRAAGKEVFLHQPMEALGGQPPGPGAIYSGMSDAEIRALLRKNMDEIGPIAGINNHQGSKITMDARMMESVLAFCREQGIVFLDSRTTADTQAPAVARSLGMKIGQRNIFIDNDQDRASMQRYINEGLAYAQKNGSAVLIGHTWSAGLGPLLHELYTGFAEQGYSVSAASRHIDSR